MRYADFEYHALEYFGLVGDEVATLLDSIEAQGGTIRGVDEDDEQFWVQVANDALDDVLEEYAEDERYPLDPRFPGDEYLDPGEEWEMTAESVEGYSD